MNSRHSRKIITSLIIEFRCTCLLAFLTTERGTNAPRVTSTQHHAAHFRLFFTKRSEDAFEAHLDLVSLIQRTISIFWCSMCCNSMIRCQFQVSRFLQKMFSVFARISAVYCFKNNFRMKNLILFKKSKYFVCYFLLFLTYCKH